MINSLALPPNFEWRSLKEILDRYMSQTEIEPGVSAVSVISALSREMRARQLRAGLSQLTGRPHSQAANNLSLEQREKEIAAIRSDVRRRMMNDASAGRWFALGRSEPSRDHEIIPARMWPFLTFDVENDSATGPVDFRDLRCAITAEFENNPALINALHETATIHRTGAAGRPSSMKIVQAEFDRRVLERKIEVSLADQARCLAKWLANYHPNAPRLEAKGIETGIRSAYWPAKAAKGLAAPK